MAVQHLQQPIDLTSSPFKEPALKKRKKGIEAFTFTAPTSQPIRSAAAAAAAAAAASTSNPNSSAAPQPKDNKIRARDYKAEESSRAFQSNWLTSFSWLRTYVEGNERFMYCNCCSLASNTKEVCILKKFKKDQLAQHAETQKHKTAAAAHPPQAGTAEFDARGAAFAIIAMKERQQKTSVVDIVRNAEKEVLLKEFQRKRIQFKVLFNILKHARPVTDYEWWDETLRSDDNFAPFMPAMHIGDDSGWEMVEAMASVAMDHTRKLIEKSKYFSVTVDASTAKDNVDYMNLQARAWAEGKLHNCFLGMKPLKQRTNAEGQVEIIMETLPEALQISAADLQRKFCAIGSDGCNTMQGSNGGVCTRMVRKFPHAVQISCTAHKVNLAAETLDEQLQFKRISDVVRDVGTYFNRSPKRKDLLQECEEKLGLDKLSLLRVNDTRWMPLKKAMSNLLRVLPAVLLALDSERKKEKNEEAERLSSLLRSAPIYFGMVAVEPLLNSLDNLTKVVQRAKLYPGDVAAAVKECQSTIKTKYSSTGPVDRLAWQNLLDLANLNDAKCPFIADKNGNVFLTIGEGTTVLNMKDLPEIPTAGVAVAEIGVNRIKQAIYDALKAATASAALAEKALELRLPSSELMEALGLATPRYWMDYVGASSLLAQTEFQHKFVKHMAILVKQFGEAKLNADGETVAALIDATKLENQAANFRDFMLSETEKLQKIIEQERIKEKKTVGSIKDDMGGEAVEVLWGNRIIPRNISEWEWLASLIMSIPFGSVENERQFSSMNLVFTDLRNSLKEKHFNDCMAVRATPLTVQDFPFWDAFLVWKAKKKRRGAHL
ncbi:hypothetical protein Ndes2526B_g05133 [Nannochloris sp. 'desiccata']